MGSLSVWHWLIFLAVALLLFGGSGKISSIMGDMAEGIKSFKKGLADDPTEAAGDVKALGEQAADAAAVAPAGVKLCSTKMLSTIGPSSHNVAPLAVASSAIARMPIAISPQYGLAYWRRRR